jgi:hypothetical protein
MARKRFESTLRSMSGKRVEIARAMEFALKRAEAADEVRLHLFSTGNLEEHELISGGGTSMPKSPTRQYPRTP